MDCYPCLEIDAQQTPATHLVSQGNHHEPVCARHAALAQDFIDHGDTPGAVINPLTAKA